MIITEQFAHLTGIPVDSTFSAKTIVEMTAKAASLNNRADGFVCYVYAEADTSKNGLYMWFKNAQGNYDNRKLDVAEIEKMIAESQPIFKDGDVAMVQVGGLKINTSLKGKTAYQVLEDILLPYVEPTITLSSSPSGFREYNQPITDVTLTATVTQKKISLTVSGEVKIDTVTITAADLNQATETAQTINGCTVKRVGNVWTITRKITGANLTTTKTYTATVTDGTKTATASATITFIRPKQYGFMGEILTDLYDNNNKAATLTYDSNGAIKKAQYAYPSAYGDLTKITDGSGVTDYTDDFAKTNETRNGVVYNVYTLKSASVHSNFTYKFA